MLKALIAIRFKSFISGLFQGGKNGKKRSPFVKILLGLALVYIIIVYGALFGMTFFGLHAPFQAAGMMNLYWSVAAFIALTLGFAGSVFATQSQLYDAKDNELLLSMPVKPGVILLSRMLVLYLTDLLFTAMVLLPAAIIHAVRAEVTFFGAVSLGLGVFLLPLGSMTLSCIFGFVFAYISSKMRNKNIVSLVVSLAFFFLYFYIISQSERVPQMIVDNRDQVAGALSTVGWRAWQLGEAVGNHSPAALVKFILSVLAPFGIVMAILSRSFVGIATRNKGAAKRVYRRRAMRVRSAREALLVKELSHFGSSAAWMLNGGLGLLFMLVGPVMVLMKAEFIDVFLSLIPGGETYLMLIIALFECLVMTLVIISSAAVSIEGRSIWIAQSAPIRACDALMSKAMMHIVVSAPFLCVSTVLMWIGMSGSAMTYVVSFLLPASFMVMTALMGVSLNVRFPRMTWPSESVPVKQGLSVGFSMGAGLALLATPVILWAVFLSDVLPPVWAALILSALYAGISALLIAYLHRTGAKRFENLTA